MTLDECFYLGRITKPFGIKGQVVFFLDVDNPDAYAELDSALVQVKGNLVPYFFHIDSMSDNKAVVTFEDISADEALSLVGNELYLPLDLLPKLTGNQFYYHEVVGFHIIDDVHGDLGPLQQVVEYPAQALFLIDHNGTEILIPVIDPVIKQVDREKRTIHIHAPEGLVELYLNMC